MPIFQPTGGGGGSSTPNSVRAFENVGIACSVSSNALTIALKQANGSSDPDSTTPVYLGFRSSTITSGAYNVRSVTGALSVVVPSGATLGLGSGGTVGIIYVYAVDTGSGVVLAVSSLYRDVFGLSSTITAISTSADDSELYATAGHSSLPFALVAKLIYNTNPNGTYSAVPNTVALVQDYDLARPATYVSTTLSADTATVTADTYADVTGASIVLNPGVWDIGFEATIELIDTAGGGAAGTFGGNIRICDSGGTLVGDAIRYVQTYSGVDTVRFPNTLSMTARNISITTMTTYKVQIRCELAAAAGTLLVAGNTNQNGALTNPDTSAIMWARRYA